MNVSVQIHNAQALDKPRRILLGLPRKTTKIVHDVAKMFERQYRLGILNNRLVWRGILLHRTRAQMTGSMSAEVIMPEHGINVDSMIEQRLQVIRGSNIASWMMTAPNSPWRGRDFDNLPSWIKVRPHPHLAFSFQSGLPRIQPIVEGHLNSLVKNA